MWFLGMLCRCCIRLSFWVGLMVCSKKNVEFFIIYGVVLMVVDVFDVDVLWVVMVEV